MEGYTGINCESYDVCFDACYNGGTCMVNTTLPSGYQCECPLMYDGARCEIEADVCTTYTPCQNGGTCLPNSALSAGYECRCTPQYQGVNCQTMISDVCTAMRPCLNGGTCFASSTDVLAFICVCQDGFNGEKCQFSRVDLCLSYNPCENNASCVQLAGASSVTCQCALGYVGVHCERVDTGNGDCLPNPCGNGGTCNPDPFVSLGYTCTCPPAFSGNNCELEYFGCASNPCQSGGTCVVHTYGAYYCQCPEGYVGRLCENAGPCASAPCFNGGICMENPQIRDPTVRAYNCICESGFMGTHCEQLSTGDPCTPNPCNNGGICFKSDIASGTQQFVCQCPPQTVGNLCNDDPCLSMPCVNGGSCEPIFNPVTGELVAVGCICPTGYTGPSCAVVGPCQSNPCQNGGTCIDSTGSSPDPLRDWDDGAPLPAQLAFFCICLSDWTGTTCSERRDDPCAPNPCLNSGSCFTTDDVTFTCVCQQQYAGTRCETRIEPCNPNPCQNSGVCIATDVTLYSCQCSPPYVGTHCERRDPCDSGPCRNGGTCYRSWQDELVICTCTPGFTGNLCDQIIDQCLSQPCMNGGLCFNGDTSYSCLCPGAFTGESCQIFEPCMSEPCKNGGSCYTGESSYTCVCGADFTGTQCQEMVNPCLSNPCVNGGQCYTDNTGISSYQCVCSGGFTGDRCQELNPVTSTVSPTTTRPVIVKDACMPNPCFNDGTCLPIGSGLFSYTCLCPMHYAGLTCAVHLQPQGVCDPNPCLNGGICLLYTGLGVGREYECICGDQYTGGSCALAIERPSSTPAPDPTTRQVDTAQTTQASHETTTIPIGGPSTHEPVSITDHVASTKLTETTTARVSTTLAAQICFHGASVYEEGATRVNDCVQCICLNGEWLCGERNCDCMIDGTRYSSTDTWTNDCNTCICNGGVSFCTQMNCGKACNHNGVYYVNGDNRQNGCNTCECVEGDWTCSDNSCGDACLFGPDTFLEGEMRKESCNSCFCLKDAQWLCTVRDCEGSPVIISVSFKINHEFAAIQDSQQEFIQVFKDDMRRRYNLSKQNIQNVMVFPGSILVMFDLVEVKDSNINVEAVASDLQFKVQARNYTIKFQDLDLFADPNSYVKEKLETGSPSTPSNTIFANLSQETIILIAVIGCGILGLIVVVASVCFYTRRAPRRARTEYLGDTRLPRASDYDDGFVNNGYQEPIAVSNLTNTTESLQRNDRVVSRR